MAIEKVREAVRLRLEELYEVESEYQQVLSKVVIPFSEIFKKQTSKRKTFLLKIVNLSWITREFTGISFYVDKNKQREEIVINRIVTLLASLFTGYNNAISIFFLRTSMVSWCLIF